MLTDLQTSPSRRTYLFSKLGSISLTVLHHLLAISPAMPIVLVYLFSWRLEALIGHWPVYLVDDPKITGPEDFLSSLLYSSVLLSACLRAFSLVLFPAITVLRRRYYPTWWAICLVIIYLLSWLLSLYDPAMRMKWYVD